jgi:hypothetical protein
MLPIPVDADNRGFTDPMAYQHQTGHQRHASFRSQISEVYYYRLQSPVVFIEFDHTTHVSLRQIMPPGPSRNHFHITLRTPNGNDYGKDLLRQHYAMTEGDPNHQHEPTGLAP